MFNNVNQILEEKFFQIGEEKASGDAKKTVGSFEQNFNKLEKLSTELQRNEISIDDLVPRMKEALSSIKVCQTVLGETKSQLTEIDKAFEELEAFSDKADE